MSNSRCVGLVDEDEDDLKWVVNEKKLLKQFHENFRSEKP